MSLASKGKKKSDIHCKKIKERMLKKAKSILQFDLDGNFIKEYISISEACRETKIHKATIIQNIKNKRLTGGRFLWSVKENKNIDYDELNNIGKYLSEKYIKLKNENNKIKLNNFKKRHVKK